MGLISKTARQYYENKDYGNYQFTSLNRIIQQFMVAYVGDNKLISKVNITDVQFHAMRALQELSFDTFKSCKSQEITVPSTLQMILPQDYVNYTKVSWVDSAGIKHLLYPTSKTSNPFSSQQDDDGDFLFHDGDLIESGNLIDNGNFNGGSASWELNKTLTSLGAETNLATTTNVGAQSGDPLEGWFYGWNGNALAAYDLPQWSSIIQKNVPIRSGEKYTITYTVSGYTSGSWLWYIIDENGDSSTTTTITANGTYSETITAGDTYASYVSQLIFFTNSSATNGNITVDSVSITRVGDEESSTTWENYSSTTPSENNNDDYEDDTYWPADGERYGLDPQHAQVNGSYYIDCNLGKIHFSSNISGKTVVLDYISDSLGTDEEMKVHKFAEEAMYKWIMHAILSTRANVPEYQVSRLKKERTVEIRKAKLRLSNIKLEEITQILRGKSKQIKH